MDEKLERKEREPLGSEKVQEAERQRIYILREERKKEVRETEAPKYWQCSERKKRGT